MRNGSGCCRVFYWIFRIHIGEGAITWLAAGTCSDVPCSRVQGQTRPLNRYRIMKVRISCFPDGLSWLLSKFAHRNDPSAAVPLCTGMPSSICYSSIHFLHQHTFSPPRRMTARPEFRTLRLSPRYNYLHGISWSPYFILSPMWHPAGPQTYLQTTCYDTIICLRQDIRSQVIYTVGGSTLSPQYTGPVFAQPSWSVVVRSG